MSLVSDKRSLAYLLDTSPVREARPSLIGIEDQAVSLKDFQALNTSKPWYDDKPEYMAARFYMLQHAVGIIESRVEREEPLSNEQYSIVMNYVVTTTDIGRRLFVYLVYAATREYRHCGGMSATLRKSIDSKYGPNVTQLLSGIAKGGGGMKHWDRMIAATDMNFADYLGGLTLGFNKGKFGSAFGGKKWGMIAECVSRFVSGETSLETMIDTCFALQHNTCTVFNKGLFVQNANEPTLLTVLDVQRVGAMPQYAVRLGHKCLSMSSGSGFTPDLTHIMHPDLAPTVEQRDELHNSFMNCHALLGEDFCPSNATIDWELAGQLSPKKRKYIKSTKSNTSTTAPKPTIQPTDAVGNIKVDHTFSVVPMDRSFTNNE